MDKISYEYDFSKILVIRPELGNCEALQAFMKIFQKELNYSCEFSFRNFFESDYEITIEQNEADFHSHVREFFAYLNIDEAVLEKYELSKKMFADSSCIVKAGFSAERCESFSIYYQSPCFFSDLAKLSMSPLPESLFKRYSDLFSKKVFFAGIDFIPYSVVPYILVHPPYSGGISSVLSDLMANSQQIAGKLKRNFDFLMGLAKNDIFVSFTPDGSKVKADFQHIPVTAAFQSVKDLELSADDFKTAVKFAMDSDEKFFYYFSISSRDGILSGKYYFKRNYFAKGDVTEVFAASLEKMKLLAN